MIDDGRVLALLAAAGLAVAGAVRGSKGVVRRGRRASSEDPFFLFVDATQGIFALWVTDDHETSRGIWFRADEDDEWYSHVIPGLPNEPGLDRPDVWYMHRLEGRKAERRPVTVDTPVHTTVHFSFYFKGSSGLGGWKPIEGRSLSEGDFIAGIDDGSVRALQTWKEQQRSGSRGVVRRGRRQPASPDRGTVSPEIARGWAAQFAELRNKPPDVIADRLLNMYGGDMRTGGIPERIIDMRNELFTHTNQGYGEAGLVDEIVMALRELGKGSRGVVRRRPVKTAWRGPCGDRPLVWRMFQSQPGLKSPKDVRVLTDLEDHPQRFGTSFATAWAQALRGALADAEKVSTSRGTVLRTFVTRSLHLVGQSSRFQGGLILIPVPFDRASDPVFVLTATDLGESEDMVELSLLDAVCCTEGAPEGLASGTGPVDYAFFADVVASLLEQAPEQGIGSHGVVRRGRPESGVVWVIAERFSKQSEGAEPLFSSNEGYFVDLSDAARYPDRLGGHIDGVWETLSEAEARVARFHRRLRSARELP